MAPRIVKYAYDRSPQLIGVILFAVSCRGPEYNTDINNYAFKRGSKQR